MMCGSVASASIGVLSSFGFFFFCFLFCFFCFVFLLMIRRPPRSTLDRSSAASDVYKRQVQKGFWKDLMPFLNGLQVDHLVLEFARRGFGELELSLIHISEPTRPY